MNLGISIYIYYFFSQQMMALKYIRKASSLKVGAQGRVHDHQLLKKKSIPYPQNLKWSQDAGLREDSGDI